MRKATHTGDGNEKMSSWEFFAAYIQCTDFVIEKVLTSPPGVRIRVIPPEADEFQSKSLMIRLA